MTAPSTHNDGAHLNRLLLRQLRKHAPDLDPATPELQKLLGSISSAYNELEHQLSHLEHVLAVTSAELNDANERIRREAAENLASLDRHYQQTLELQQGMIMCVRRTSRYSARSSEALPKPRLTPFHCPSTNTRPAQQATAKIPRTNSTSKGGTPSSVTSFMNVSQTT